jgi:mRNA export factor
MDTKENLLVVATADRQVSIFNLSNPTVTYKTLLSPLKYQTRVVSCFTAGNGFAIGSVEGRCAIQYVEDKVSLQGPLTSGFKSQLLLQVSS